MRPKKIDQGRWSLIDEPEPKPFEETEKDLLQLETIARYVARHWPELKGEQVDRAVLLLLSHVPSRRGGSQ